MPASGQHNFAYPTTHRWRCVRVMPIQLLLCVFLTACANQKLLDGQYAYRTGDLATAQAQLEQYASKEGREKAVDRVIAYLELATIQHERGDFAASNQSFALADAEIERLDESAAISISRESLALLTNLNALPYPVKSYDRIMVSVYRALNFMHLGQIANARAELRKAYERQRESVDRHAKRIEQAKKEHAQAARTDPAYQHSRDNPQLEALMQSTYRSLNQYTAYADFVIPFAELMQAMYFTHAALDDSDLERARVSLTRLVGMVPDHPYLQDDLAIAEQASLGSPPGPRTFVIFATGTAPWRDEVRIDLPIVIAGSNRVPYVGAAFPVLKPNEVFVPALSVVRSGQRYDTQLVSDMDRVVAEEFRAELPAIITRTVLASTAKAAAAYAINEAAEGNNTTMVLAVLGTMAYQAVMNQTDRRTWASLPKRFLYASFPTPDQPTLTLTASGAYGSSTSITIVPHRTNVVMIRSINPASPLHIRTFTLEPQP